MNEKIIFTWSGGKDSAMALSELMNKPKTEIMTLLTTVTQGYQRISMHGVRKSLLKKQAQAIGLPIEIVELPKKFTASEYEKLMKQKLLLLQKKGAQKVAFGDIFLEDLKKQRENNLAAIGMKAIFPIWKRKTKKLASDFINLKFKAIITCIDSAKLDKKFIGRIYNKKFIADLPRNIDPCGENGEFHSFVFDGPIFNKPVSYEKGQIVLKNNRFYYCDLLLK